MSTKPLAETSKFLSYVLRHEPQSIGLTLDREGWAPIDALIAAAALHGRALDRALIEQVVITSDKKRFSISEDGSRIRAVQGHSTPTVSIRMEEKTPPAVLYHGTATRFLESIRQQGLLPGSRHHVHLSEDAQTATSVGQRYGQPVVLSIAAATMHGQGHRFYQADNGVWLTANVPADFIDFAPANRGQR
ncbi:RNA 2'-phosphotransferase [Acidovorax sp. SUPP2522]|uniref:RNA 2'-phosphotransferase n=1 Tax=unclassified Acidovorax TaxID=2684926 RepID=UPI00234B73E6|nr:MULTISPECIES: RNA 2'-phosphotransferase [unclassified Acidovorax]WCM97262.1 RNA 2'-phosphotransferase [Acidovorax sp. GBBC 1281]GKT15983.1 RNA 2'-phosphotransferase [Acidovorax sp. SUPP2522]